MVSEIGRIAAAAQKRSPIGLFISPFPFPSLFACLLLECFATFSGSLRTGTALFSPLCVLSAVLQISDHSTAALHLRSFLTVQTSANKKKVYRRETMNRNGVSNRRNNHSRHGQRSGGSNYQVRICPRLKTESSALKSCLCVPLCLPPCCAA